MTANYGYLLSYFLTQLEPDGEQVRLARSVGDDPLHWEPLNGGEPILLAAGGTGGSRDPFLVRAAGLPGETAGYYVIATDMRAHGQNTLHDWDDAQRYGSHSIFVWESPDLLNWSEPRLVEVSPPEAGNTWAPEATFDPETGEYFVYWASMLYKPELKGPERQGPELQGPGDRDQVKEYNRTLAATTRDFRTFSAASVWIDPGHSVIDATILKSGDYFYRFSKDERTADSSTPQGKYITQERATSLRSLAYELVADGIGGPELIHGEGPIILEANDHSRWYLYIDEYTERGYVPFETSDIASGEWTPVADYALPTGSRHGSILPLTREEWERLGTLL